MTEPDRIWINDKWEAYLRPTFDGDTSGYVRADLARPTPLAEALAVVLEAMKDGEVWGRAVNAAMPIINADLNPIAWLPVTETRKALDSALRAIGGDA